MKTFNFAQINLDEDARRAKLINLINKEQSLSDIKVILGLRPWTTTEDIINEIKFLSK